MRSIPRVVRSTLQDAVGYGGVGEPEKLPISVGGATIATMTMPPHMAFGIAACLRDPAGQVIAIIATASTQRPSGWGASSVNVYGTKPIAGQAPVDVGGITGYLWARSERKGFSNNSTIYDGANKVIAQGATIRGWALQYKLMNPAGQGIMLATFTPNSNKKTFDVQVSNLHSVPPMPALADA